MIQPQQWLKDEFLQYLHDWETAVMARPKFSAAQKYKMMLSQETLLGIRITGIEYPILLYETIIPFFIAALSFIELVKYIFTIPGVKFFLSEKISQDPLEKFFGMQRQRGGTNENPNIYQALKNTQALRVINTTCRHVTVKGNTRGNVFHEDENFNEPLKKRRRTSH